MVVVMWVDHAWSFLTPGDSAGLATMNALTEIEDESRTPKRDVIMDFARWFTVFCDDLASRHDVYSTEFSTKHRGNVQEKLVEKFLLTSTSVAVYSPSAFVTGLRKWMRSGETSS